MAIIHLHRLPSILVDVDSNIRGYYDMGEIDVNKVANIELVNWSVI